MKYLGQGLGKRKFIYDKFENGIVAPSFSFFENRRANEWIPASEVAKNQRLFLKKGAKND